MNIKAPAKFEFLDGLRGCCAIFVALSHALLFTGHTDDYLKSTLKPLTIFMSYGHFSVAVFIVLSGFCLTIPVAKSDQIELKGGFARYVSRRFTRIIPPYYFALLLSLIFIFFLPILQIKSNTVWDGKIPVTTNSIIAHILLIHNFSNDWINNINGPLWSVATEWQIYFVFPLLILIWRKYNLTISFLSAIVLGFLISRTNQSIHSWFLGLFAMGMFASVICFSRNDLFSSIRSRINWPILSWIAAILLVAFLALLRFKHVSLLVSESVVGFLICVNLISFTLNELSMNKKPLLLRFFNSKVAVFLGSFSYSIYLIHSPILAFINLELLSYNFGIDSYLLIMVFISVPISVFISYGFYHLVEKRFIPAKYEPLTMPELKLM
jgi:peptidoglycan/LPS O-acetylase OafA/YrhL